MTWLLVTVAAGLGAVLRLWAGSAVERHSTLPVPLGTLVINVTGSFLLGFVTGLARDQFIDTTLATVLGVGLLGGFTTFSTASVEAARLQHHSGWRGLVRAIAHSLAMLGTCLVAALLGLALS